MLETELHNAPGGGDSPSPGVSHDEILLELVDQSCLWVARHQSGWQFGEQGVIAAIVDHLGDAIPPEQRWVVEFGAGDGDKDSLPLTCEGFLKRAGWKTLLIEGDADKAKSLTRRFGGGPVVVLNQRVEIAGDGSIDRHLSGAGCPADPAVMIVDVDSVDYHIVRAMDSRPAVLCVETLDILSPINNNTPMIPEVEECGKFLNDRFGTQIQANAAAMDTLMIERGYRLVYRTRINGIYVRGDVAKQLAKKMVLVTESGATLPGYESVAPDKVAELSDLDEVFAPDLLHRLKIEDAKDRLREWALVLKPHGTLRLSVPNMATVLADLQKEEGHHQKLQAILANGAGLAGFTRDSLASFMYAAGFGSIVDSKAVSTLDADPVCLNLEGVKRSFPKLKTPRITMILNQPRLAFTGHEKALLLLAQTMKFDVQESYGSFWDRDMTLATQAAISKYNPDLLVFTDYDSMMEPSDMRTLVDTINNDPTMAAIGAVQPSRHHDGPLVLDPLLDYSGDITKVRFQHFGLMVIRREVFDELPQPWFWSVPGKDARGEWDWSAFDRSDADITFWRNLEMLGFNVYQHNRVNIGHIIQAVKYVRDKGKGVQLIPIENYWRHGKPKDAVFNHELYKPAPPAAKPDPSLNGKH